MIHYSDTNILEGIQRRDDVILRYTYDQYYPMIRFFIIRNSGTESDAQDIFQEAMIAIFIRIRKKELNLTCSFKTFIYSVCRHKWLQHLDRNRQFNRLHDLENHVVLEEKEIYEDELQLRKRLYQRHFLNLSESCREILSLFLQKVPFEEVARKMGYKNRQYAIKRKYECVRSLYTRIMNDPEYKRHNL